MRTAISFFAGAGGLDMGLVQAGFDIKLAVELESLYVETLLSNHDNLNAIQGDIMDFNKEKVYEKANLGLDDEIDLMVGGSPCQSFSTAGKRQAFDSSGGQAMLQFIDLINEIQPKAFLLENVKGLLSASLKHRPIDKRGKDAAPLEEAEERGSALKHVLERIKGYHVKYQLLNSADYGVPQKRERVFLVGIRKDLGLKFEFPKVTHNQEGSDGLERWVTFADVLNRIEEFGILKHHYVNYSPERLRYMQMIPVGGGNWRDLPSDIVEEAMGGAYRSGGGKVGYFRRIKVTAPAPTVLTSPHQNSTNLGHPFENRPLSIEEYLGIQEFPLNYRIAGTLSKQYIQIGNAVPVRLGKAMGKAILDQLNKAERLKYYRQRRKKLIKKLNNLFKKNSYKKHRG